jgi:hypothetical protein
VAQLLFSILSLVVVAVVDKVMVVAVAVRVDIE